MGPTPPQPSSNANLELKNRFKAVQPTSRLQTPTQAPAGSAALRRKKAAPSPPPTMANSNAETLYQWLSSRASDASRPICAAAPSKPPAGVRAR